MAKRSASSWTRDDRPACSKAPTRSPRRFAFRHASTRFASSIGGGRRGYTRPTLVSRNPSAPREPRFDGRRIAHDSRPRTASGALSGDRNRCDLPTDLQKKDLMNHPAKPNAAVESTPRFGSDCIADMLRALDIEYIALTPGASFRGLHDSLVNYLGNERPEMLLCVHEEHAVALAHGYARVTGKPLAVALHANVGLMHATMAIFNAWCDRIPMLLIGGVGPIDAMQRRPWVDWIHTAADLAALVRGYTKWDDQPGSVAAALESILRAYRISTTAPQGPVYVCLDATIQEQVVAPPPAMPALERFPASRP